MLLWQRKNAPKFAFGAQLSAVIVLMHAVALLLLCIHSVAVHDELTVDVSNSYVIGADIIVVPFQKTVKQVVAPAAPPVTPEPQRDTTVIKDIKTVPQPKTRPIEKKVEPEQSIEPKPLKVEEKPMVAKPEPSTKEREPEKPSESDPLKERVVEKAEVAKPKASLVQTMQTQPTPQYIGTRQLQTMQIQRAIVEQVQMHWHPPEGLEPDLEVVLSIHIDNNGGVADVDTKQSSGVFAYDVHARSAVYEMQFPKACWGKTITIAFK